MTALHLSDTIPLSETEKSAMSDPEALAEIYIERAEAAYWEAPNMPGVMANIALAQAHATIAQAHATRAQTVVLERMERNGQTRTVGL